MAKDIKYTINELDDAKSIVEETINKAASARDDDKFNQEQLKLIAEAQNVNTGVRGNLTNTGLETIYPETAVQFIGEKALANIGKTSNIASNITQEEQERDRERQLDGGSNLTPAILPQLPHGGLDEVPGGEDAGAMTGAAMAMSREENSQRQRPTPKFIESAGNVIDLDFRMPNSTPNTPISDFNPMGPFNNRNAYYGNPNPEGETRNLVDAIRSAVSSAGIYPDEPISNSNPVGPFNNPSNPTVPSNSGLTSTLGNSQRIAYGALATLNGMMQANRGNIGGESYLSSQVGEETGSSILPGIGAGFGMALTGGSLVGGLIGTGIGQVAKEGIDTLWGGHVVEPEKAAREAKFGGAISNLKEFEDALHSGTGYIKDLSTSVDKLSKNVQLTPGGIINNLGPASKYLGINYNETIDAYNKFTSNPMYRQFAVDITGTNKVGSAEYNQAAKLAMMDGDYNAMLAGHKLAEGTVAESTVKAIRVPETDWHKKPYDNLDPLDPNSNEGRPYQKGYRWYPDPTAMESQKKTERQDITDFNALVGAENISIVAQSKIADIQNSLRLSLAGGATDAQGNVTDILNTGYKAMQATIPTLTVQTEAANQASINAKALAQQGISTSETDKAADEAKLKEFQDKLSKATPNSKESKKIQGWIDNQNRIIASDAGIEIGFQEKLAKESADIGDRNASLQEFKLQAEKSSIDTPIAEQSAKVAGFTLDFTKALYDGKSSVDDIKASFATIAQGMKDNADKYDKGANDKMLSPEDRAKYLEQENNIRTSIIEKTYSITQSVFNAQAATIGVNLQQQQNQYKLQQLSGDPSTAYTTEVGENKYISELIALKEKQLATANNMGDKQRIQNEINELNLQRQSIPIQAATNRYYGWQEIAGLRGQGSQISAMNRMEYEGNSPKVTEDIETQRENLRWQMASDLDREKTASSQIEKDKAKNLYAQHAAQYADTNKELAAGIGAFSPDQIKRLAEAQGAVERMNLGFATSGNRQSAVLEQRNALQSELSSAVKSLKDDEAVPGANKSYLESKAAPIIQGLKTQITQSNYESDRMWGQNLPSLIVGGTTNLSQWMPSRAQTADRLESQGMGRASALTIGFKDWQSGHDATMGSQGYFGAGSSTYGAKPGDYAAQGIAIAKALKDAGIGAITINVSTDKNGVTQVNRVGAKLNSHLGSTPSTAGPGMGL